MPAFNTDTPRANLTVADRQFTCPAPYIAGHALTEGEASHMNQLLRENVRNNVAGKLKVEDGKPPVEFSQEDFDKYVAGYEFGQRRVGTSTPSLSPVEREARRIAVDRINARLKELNKTIDRKTDEGKAQWETMVATLSAREDIVKEAKKRIGAVEKISIEELGLD